MVNNLETFYLNNWDEKLSVNQVKIIFRQMKDKRKLKNLKIVNDQFLKCVPAKTLCSALANLSSLELTCQQISFQPIFLEIAAETKLVDLDISCNMLTDVQEEIFAEALVKIKVECQFKKKILSKLIYSHKVCSEIKLAFLSESQPEQL